MKVIFGVSLYLILSIGRFAANNNADFEFGEYLTIRELLEKEYGEYFYETDDEGNTIIDVNPDQMILHENGFYIFYMDVYEGMNGEGDEGIGLIYTEDLKGILIDYMEVYTGSFGDSFQETVDIFLIPQNGFYIKQHLDGIENIEWVDGYPTGDPYVKDSYIIGTVDTGGMISAKESDYPDEFHEQFLQNVDDAIIKDIRNYYGIIEKCITNKTFNVQSFIIGNKTYDVYSGNNYLKRISVTENSDTGKQLIKHFYFKVNTCFFVYEIGDRANEKIENRIYFHQKTVMRILSGADKKMITGAEFDLKGLDSKLESESLIEIVKKRL